MTKIDPIEIPSLERRREALAARHADLDLALAEEISRPLPDMAELRRLKQAKLRLKDEMASIDGLRRTLARGRTRQR